MADFRKWLLAFAVAAFALGVSSVPAHAAGVITGPSFTCTANAGVPPLVRAEGITELVGDIVLDCIGGTPTAAGTPIPLSNIQISLNTNITSRLYSNGLSEALLIVDEAFPTSPNPSSQVAVPGAPSPEVLCPADGLHLGAPPCQVLGTGGGTNPYGAAGAANVFQGVPVNTNGAIASNAGVAFLGVPIDAPGTVGTRVIRITNIRANAAGLGVSSTLVPTQVFAFISITGSQQVSIANPTQTVAYIVPGLTGSSTAATNLQCLPPTKNITVSFTEGFASSFKIRNIASSTSTPTSNLSSTTPPAGDSNTIAAQNVPGFPYNTESGFYDPTLAGTAGLADHGTRLLIRFSAVQAGVTLTAPTSVFLYPLGTDFTGSSPNQLPTGLLKLVTTDANGDSAPGASYNANGNVTLSGGAGWATYEVVASTTSTIETTGPITITTAFSGTPVVGTNQVKLSFAPLSTVTTADAVASIPRFIDNATAQNAITVNLCTCDLLFPFVTNQAGFDTGIAIANTSQDPFGTTAQQGTVTLNYYGNSGGTAAAPAAATSQVVPAGQELIFTLSGGGNFGIAATPGFQGYIIAVAQFQYCHAFAFISDIGAQKLAEGYLAIQLDVPTLNRTGQSGENEGH